MDTNSIYFGNENIMAINCVIVVQKPMKKYF